MKKDSTDSTAKDKIDSLVKMLEEGVLLPDNERVYKNGKTRSHHPSPLF